MTAGGARRRVPVLAMGCRWAIDTTDAGDDVHEAISRRWARATDLDERPDSLVLEGERHAIVLATTDAEATSASARSAAVVRVRDPESVAYDLSREVTRQGIARLRGRCLLVHAAALSDDQGRALVLVAPSGGGKSTAATTLGRSLGYVTDESVVLTEDLEIAPYPKPPSLVVDEDRGRKDEPSPDELGLGATPTRPRLVSLLTLRRDPTTTDPAIEAVDLLDQLLALIPETSSLWMLPDGLDRLARAATAGGGPHELRYSEITGCADVVDDHLRSAAAGGPEVTWRHHPGPGEAGPTPSRGRTTTPAHVRAPWDDAVECDGRVLLLRGPEPFLFSGVGALAWLRCDEPRTLDELLTRAVAALGEHPDARRLVGDGIAELVEAGVLLPV